MIYSMNGGMTMNFSELLDPGATLGAFLISTAASLFVGIILGFFSGKKYEKSKIYKTNQIGGINVSLQDSNNLR